MPQDISEPRPVECLGLSFPNDEARRAHFLKRLAAQLEDPEFRAQEGFPIGPDELILELSNPPFYTACPNPFIPEFIEYMDRGLNADDGFAPAPFAADVSEGKMEPIYNAHSYHTKVPYKAIIRYILHYTRPGETVFDPFCGTGMTGVAAQLCGDREVIKALGYRVDDEGLIHAEEQGQWRPFSRLGVRHAILNDLSPVAAFIAANYNAPTDADAFRQEALAILDAVGQQLGWMYQTLHEPGSKDLNTAIKALESGSRPSLPIDKRGIINSLVWSDVFACPDCDGELVFHEIATGADGKVKESFDCLHCGLELNKRKLQRVFIQSQDSALGKIIRQAKQVPVQVNYSFGKRRFNKKPDAYDLALIAHIEAMTIPDWFPTERMIPGRETRRNDPIGLTHVHHFYTKRNLAWLAAIKARCHTPQTRLWFNAQLINLSKLNRYRPGVSFPYNPLSGTLYIGSQVSEANAQTAYRNKVEKLAKAFAQTRTFNLVGTSSATSAPGIMADYVFTDPPFGANIDYSELSFLWEAWLGLRTDNRLEAIASKAQNKGVEDYRELMAASFKRAFDSLKPGRWFTLVFSNTQAEVWNAIQDALHEAGFVIESVAALDKQQGSFKAVTTSTAVKQDLVISACKRLEYKKTSPGKASSEAVWDFVRTHLNPLPSIRPSEGSPALAEERDPRILFDRMVAWCVRTQQQVPMSSQEFQAGLGKAFETRDGLIFLPHQAQEYDQAIATFRA